MGARARNTWKGDEELQNLVSRLHIGYFASIAVVECVSAGFLLRKFGRARRAGKDGIGEVCFECLFPMGVSWVSFLKLGMRVGVFFLLSRMLGED